MKLPPKKTTTKKQQQQQNTCDSNTQPFKNVIDLLSWVRRDNEYRHHLNKCYLWA